MICEHDNGGWQRVSSSHPCRICGKPDWCGVLGDSASPSLVICMRVSDGAAGSSTNHGYIHVLKPPLETPRRDGHTATIRLRNRRRDLDDLVRRWADGTSRDDLEEMGSLLGINPDGLLAIGACRVTREEVRASGTDCYPRSVSAFPMFSASGEIVGVRLRTDHRRKWTIKGSREGLFLPDALNPDDTLIIVEGPTDTAALLGINIEAIGRPSCLGGVTEIVKIAKSRSGPIVILSDCDAPGRRGANTLAMKLRAYGTDVRVAEPPEGLEDARAWVQTGVDRSAVLDWIDANAKSFALRVSTEGGGAT